MSADRALEVLVAASGNPWSALAVKASLALLGALALLGVSRRASAAMRHLLAAATFGVLLLLPLVASLAPARAVAVRTSPAAAVPAQGLARPPADLATNALAAGPSRGSVRRLDHATTKALAVAYAGGVAVFLLALAIGIGRLYRLRARGDVSVVGTRLANELARREGLRDGIEVVTSPELAVPLTFGWTHPVVLLPAETAAWSEEEMMRALRHEIEHVARGDWATQVLSRVALAVYWIHPFAWLLWRRLRLEAERACDDAVVRSQGQAETYAEQLVALARRVRDHGEVPALAMATRTNLGRRVESILAAGLRRAPRSRLATAGALAAALLGVAAVGPLRLTHASAQPARADRTPVPDEERGDLDESLFEAAQRGDVARMRELLDAGAKAGAVLPGDGTPLIAAARGGSVAAIELLIASGADVNRAVEGDGNPLIAAAQHGHVDAVRLLLGRGAAIDAGVPGDGNALIMAAGAGQADVVRLLLDQGASIEQVVPGDENALIHASESGQADVVRLLIAGGADVNARVRAETVRGGFEWRTPLSMARRNGHAEVVRILQAAGARE
jgi:bla regulator protein blaR1